MSNEPVERAGRLVNMKPAVNILITDLDNTLYDWFEFWYNSFTAMLEQTVAISGISAEELIPEIKKVYEKHGTSEYSFLIEELTPLVSKHPGQDLRQVYEPAIRAYRQARKERLQLYPSVLSTLQAIKKQGTLVVAYTESLEFYSTYRIRNLCLDGLLDVVYFPEDHELPEGLTADQIRHYAPEHYKLQVTQTKHTPKGEMKPNPQLLRDIIRQVGGDVSKAAYVGDKVPKDVKMAQDAGVIDVYAKYGDTVKDHRYQLLRRVTHWKSAAVEKEKTTTTAEVPPTYTLESSFGEILDKFTFLPKDRFRLSAQDTPSAAE